MISNIYKSILNSVSSVSENHSVLSIKDCLKYIKDLNSSYEDESTSYLGFPKIDINNNWRIALRYNIEIDKKLAQVLIKILNRLNIKELIVENNKLSDESIKNLVKILQETKVDDFSVENSKIDPDEIKLLTDDFQKTNVTTFSLRWNSIGTEGAKILGKNLKDTKVIKLDLLGCSLKMKRLAA